LNTHARPYGPCSTVVLTYLDTTPPPQPQPPPITTATRLSLDHAPPGATPWPSEMPPPATWACGGGPATTALITSARRRRLPSHASDRRMSWCVTPSVRPAVTLAYSARHDGGGGRAAKPAPPPPPLTPLPGAAPLATPPHGGSPGPGRRRRARPWTGTMAPPDGEDFAPHPAALIISHVADRRDSARKE
jgi:hypothetical protein